MGTNGIVPDEPVNELQVEGIDIVSKQCPIPHHEVLPERAIEPLHAGVHFGSLGVGVVLHNAELFAGLAEERRKLTSVVALNLGNGKRSHFDELLEKVRSRGRGVGGVRSSKGELPLHINGCEYVALGAIYEAYNSVHLHAPLHLSTYLFPLHVGLFNESAGLSTDTEAFVLRQEASPLDISEYATTVRL